MADFAPLINGIAYDWSSITCLIQGKPVIGISSISYEATREINDNYGVGGNPVSRGFGNITRTGSITLHMSEVEALQIAAPRGELFRIPEFTIIVSFVPENGNVTTHTLKNCRFKGNMRDMNVNDTVFEIEIELAIGDIKWNV